MHAITRIDLLSPGFELLLADARAEGFAFIETLAEDWACGANRFDGPGEVLAGNLNRGIVVAVGALGLDPFAGDLEVGRIRRVYVRPAWRNSGIGRSLVEFLVKVAKNEGRFRSIRLRAENRDAGRLYESIGFVPIVDPNATHILELSQISTEHGLRLTREQIR